jgi:hypothetical protein
VPKLGAAHAVNPKNLNSAYCAICARPNAEHGLGSQYSVNSTTATSKWITVISV